MASQKRCLYEVLGLSLDCSPEEIRLAYRKLALQRHPDKLIKTGIPEEQATAAFQELVNAYEVLSDPRERSWYDSNRSKILFSEAKSQSKKSTPSSIPDLYSFFSNSVFSGFGDTGKGFFKVYGDLFAKIYAQEVSFVTKLGLSLDTVRDAPMMGNLESPYTQVSAFYNYWLGFCSVMDFSWVDEFEPEFGMNRKSRKYMEEKNDKLRKKARKEFNETVRGLAGFVKKRDKRVIQMQVKKNLEMEKKKEEEKARKKLAEREKLERAMLYEEPDWAKIDDEEIGKGFEEVLDDSKKDEVKELYCVVCSKKFKSDKQWKNHEQSKKHKEKVAELKYSFRSEDKEEEEEDLDETQEDLGPSVSAEEDVVVDELSEKFEDAFESHEEQTEEVKISSSDDGEEGEDEEQEEVEDEINVVDVNKDNEADDSDGTDDEMSILKAMLSGLNRKKSSSTHQSEMPSSSKTDVNTDNEEPEEVMEYDTHKKNSRRRRAAKKEGGKKSNGETGKEETSEVAEEEMEFMIYDTRKKGNRKNRAPKKESGKESNGESGRPKRSVVSEEVISNSAGNNVQVEQDHGHDYSDALDSSSLAGDEVGHNSSEDPPLEKNVKDLKKPVDKRGTEKADMNTKSKITSKGKKQRGQKKSTSLSCDTCGENFESRNKLHTHLGDTGHAALKSR